MEYGCNEPFNKGQLVEKRLQQVMSDTNRVLEPFSLSVGDPNLPDREPVWHLFYFNPETMDCFPVLKKFGPSSPLPDRMADLLQGFVPETPPASIVDWAKRNGLIEE